ncbi:hypothetical protein UFOVP67_22 [uncultured Caudovirales phage]|uniref:Uncharacterized protein n=1 Tax=uncultured Caudovirales phage TaxID=2100421 RepID=A0A6J5T8U5_9CAUD|nr:hypothetical protein UFOVP67_22 [uncultured Caudovirales phage]
MTTSGTYSYSVNRDQVIAAALRTLGVIDKQGTPDAIDLQNGSEALNLILKQVADLGAPLWCIQWLTIPLVTNKNEYTIGPGMDVDIPYRPTRMTSGYVRNIPGNSDREVAFISRTDYERLSGKDFQSNVDQLYYDAQLPAPILYTYGKPTNDDYVLKVSVQRPVQDVTSGSQTFDIPQEWYLPLKWRLAEELCLEYGVEPTIWDRIAAKAKAYMDKAMDWQEEEVSMIFSANNMDYR